MVMIIITTAGYDSRIALSWLLAYTLNTPGAPRVAESHSLVFAFVSRGFLLPVAWWLLMTVLLRFMEGPGPSQDGPAANKGIDVFDVKDARVDWTWSELRAIAAGYDSRIALAWLLAYTSNIPEARGVAESHSNVFAFTSHGFLLPVAWLLLMTVLLRLVEELGASPAKEQLVEL